MKNNRKKSSYYILTKNEQNELKEQKKEVIYDTLVSAVGILTVAATCLSSNTVLTDSMTLSEFLLLMFGGSATWLGMVSGLVDSVELGNLKYDIYSRAEREGRVRK